MIINNKFTRDIALERFLSPEVMPKFYIQSKSTKHNSCEATLNIPRGVMIIRSSKTDNAMTMKERNDEKPNNGPLHIALKIQRHNHCKPGVNSDIQDAYAVHVPLVCRFNVKRHEHHLTV